MSPPVGVVGGGGFGLGLAAAATRAGHEVVLWTRKATGDDPGPGIRSTSELSALSRAELIFLAVPSPHMGTLAAELGKHLDGGHLLVHVSRGLWGEGCHTLSQLLRAETPCRRVGALAGPLVAEALEKEAPSGAVIGSLFPEVVEAVRVAIAGPKLRIERTEDVIGVELASATVGVLAVAAGYGRAIEMGPSATALALTRGMNEGARIGHTLGALPETFAGLAGMGDLMAATADDGRPEYRLGRALGAGKSLPKAASRAGAHIEGVTVARRLADHAARTGVSAPICSAFARVFEGTLSPQGAITELMAEHDGRE